MIEQLPSALRFARRLTGNADLAEDLVQETLARVLKRWPSLVDESAFRSWMMQILVNADRDRRRKKQSQQTLLKDGESEQITAETPEPFENAVAGEMREKIEEALNGLPERQRQVAWLRFGEDFDAKEIANTLEISTANVHACLSLARVRVAEAIGFERSKKQQALRE